MHIDTIINLGRLRSLALLPALLGLSLASIASPFLMPMRPFKVVRPLEPARPLMAASESIHLLLGQEVESPPILQERLPLDDMEDISDWYNGSPEETVLSISKQYLHAGNASVCFANTVDHTKGEVAYPVGWPRFGKNLAEENLTDWSEYDFFECWIYTESSRADLPKSPLSVGFYHTGQKRSTSFPLTDVALGSWTQISIPVTELLDSSDVQRVQFNISESNYLHGDQVDFYIASPALVRYVNPQIEMFQVERKLLYSTERTLRAQYELVGFRGQTGIEVQLSLQERQSDVLMPTPPLGDFPQPPEDLLRLEKSQVGRALRAAQPRGGASASTGPPQSCTGRTGEVALTLRNPLQPGRYQAYLTLRNGEGRIIGEASDEFRVIAGPFFDSNAAINGRADSKCRITSKGRIGVKSFDTNAAIRRLSTAAKGLVAAGKVAGRAGSKCRTTAKGRIGVKCFDADAAINECADITRRTRLNRRIGVKREE